ncbi:molybdopterin-dependent oxidoreductase [Actinospica durhamensis]|uniref:Molybdopterin-dependent oxidoreductase n=1 Tax=Actinospica durhamensis TaxID=1508375 RepID=A0A941EWH0_9ACTN|nr:molybdopterin-dependent oxidoreductase [Actinospica durhamensis]MBR7838568.1 molybdopterin-dependent oxidoreductase [Actinospica durhamensis]
MTATEATAASRTATIRVRGEVRRPAEFAMADLWALPQHEREVAFTCRRSGPRHHRFTGPLLLDVLRRAEPVFGSGQRKDRLRYVISLRATDEHRVVLAWAEIDPEFGNCAILLGLTRDGVRLDDRGPHLVVPGDVCGARNVSGIADVRVHADLSD